jgi:TonB family protein
MGKIASKAQGCYKGNQGTAMVKLTVGPSGSVTKVSVSGAFAGTPEGSCVESAVKSASFPPWDGGPQSFTYSYMLSD